MARRGLFILAALCSLCVAPARAETLIGIQGLQLQGTHAEQVDSTKIAGAAALLELRQRWRWIDIAAEGAPSTGGHGYLITPIGYPQPVTALSLFDAVSHVRIGPTGRFWAGAGIVVVNQITSLGSPPEAAASRLAGTRYEVLTELPVGRHGSVDLRAAWMPSLHGSLNYALGIQVPAPFFHSETAEATDASIEYVLHERRMQYAIGFRTINYVAQFTIPKELADRNTGLASCSKPGIR